MFDRASNVQLGEKLPKFHYPKLLVMYGVEHTMSFLFNDISKIIIVHQIISSHKKMYNILILVYIISQIQYLDWNHKIFTILILYFSVEIILEWPGISWEYINTCGWKK